MRLPEVLPRYSQDMERQRNEALEREDRLNRKRGQHIVLPPPEEIHLFSPNGTKYAITVSDTGVLGTVLR